MSVTVREVLALDVLRRAEPRVVAGADHLDRPVRWVHIAEISDIATLISGGELLLTTGIGLAADAGAQRLYIESIADAGAVGLVVELGRMFDTLPPAMVRAAAERGLPLVALQHTARYIEVTEAVHRAIVNHQYDLLREASDISRDFTSLILDGAGIEQVITRLAQVLGNPVLLEDAAHNVVCLSGGGARSHLGVPHDVGARGQVQSGPGCVWTGIWLRHEEWGRVHVLAPPAELTALVLDRAGAALGLVLLSQQNAAHVAGRAGSALLADALAGRIGSVPEFVRRAQSLGVDLGSGRLVGLVAAPVSDGDAAPLGELARRSGLSEQQRQQLRLTVCEEITRAAAERGCAALAGLDADRVLCVVSVPAGPAAVGSSAVSVAPAAAVPEAAAAVLDGIVASAVRRLRAVSLGLVAGAGRPVGADGSLQRTMEEAVQALYSARSDAGRPASGRSAGLRHFDDLGVYQLLTKITDPELERFADAELGALLSRNNSRLLATLRCYLDNAGRKAPTAEALRVQRRTLYARLARISAILGRDLNAADARTRLMLALQAHDLLAARRRGPAS